MEGGTKLGFPLDCHSMIISILVRAYFLFWVINQMIFSQTFSERFLLDYTKTKIDHQ